MPSPGGGCTRLCSTIESLTLREDGGLPTNEDIRVALLNASFTKNEVDNGLRAGVFNDLRTRRTKCAWCLLVAKAVIAGTSDVGKYASITAQLEENSSSFRIRWTAKDSTEDTGTRLAFFTEDEVAATSPDNARPSQPRAEHPRLIQTWLQTCDEKHGDCYSYMRQNPGSEKDWPAILTNRQGFNESNCSNFRVFDIKEGCIKQTPLSAHYVALSYVRGDGPYFALTKENHSELSTPGALLKIWEKLPRTITEAIDFLSELGERYLWVGTLCQLEDDEYDQSLGLEMIHSIFGGSYFTMIIAPKDPSIGLYEPQEVPMVDNINSKLRLAVVHSAQWHLDQSLHAESAWNLHATVLPKRVVLFANGKVFFSCQEADWSCDTWADKFDSGRDQLNKSLARLPGPLDGIVPNLEAYKDLVEDHSKHCVPTAGDAVRSMGGILRPLCAGMNSPILEGLPGYFLEHFLLFRSTTGQANRRSEFASYSWAGWDGPVEWPPENFLRYSKDGVPWYEPGNILWWIKNQRLAMFEIIEPSSRCEQYSDWVYQDSPLEKLMGKYSHILGNMEDYEQYLTDYDHMAPGHAGCASHMDLPRWESDKRFPTDQNGHVTYQPFYKEISQKAFELINGEVEFKRLWSSIMNESNTDLRMYLYGISDAVLSCRGHDVKEEEAPKSVMHDREWLFRRYPGSKWAHREDKRAEMSRYKLQIRDESARKKGLPKPEPLTTANYPPWTTLKFRSIWFKLKLGIIEEPADLEDDEEFDLVHFVGGPKSPTRPLAVPLISGCGKIVGSLDADNRGLLDHIGGEVDCIVIARSQTIQRGSALLRKDENRRGPFDLLYILAVEWREGMAYRCGVGQVYESVLEAALPGGPSLKVVQLG